jgi:hypothetical protein
MANLMGKGLTFVVRHSGASRICRMKNHDAIIYWVKLVTYRLGSVAKKWLGFKSDSIDVKHCRIAFTEQTLHVSLELVAW